VHHGGHDCPVIGVISVHDVESDLSEGIHESTDDLRPGLASDKRPLQVRRGEGIEPSKPGVARPCQF
jgi:hypothetical protein